MWESCGRRVGGVRVGGVWEACGRLVGGVWEASGRRVGAAPPGRGAEGLTDVYQKLRFRRVTFTDVYFCPPVAGSTVPVWSWQLGDVWKK